MEWISVHRYYDYINYVSGYIEILNYSYIQKQTFNVFFFNDFVHHIMKIIFRRILCLISKDNFSIKISKRKIIFVLYLNKKCFVAI